MVVWDQTGCVARSWPTNLPLSRSINAPKRPFSFYSSKTFHPLCAFCFDPPHRLCLAASSPCHFLGIELVMTMAIRNTDRYTLFEQPLAKTIYSLMIEESVEAGLSYYATQKDKNDKTCFFSKRLLVLELDLGNTKIVRPL